MKCINVVYSRISIHLIAISLRLKAKYRNMPKFLIMTLFSVDNNKTSLNELGWLYILSGISLRAEQDNVKCTSSSTAALHKGHMVSM